MSNLRKTFKSGDIATYHGQQVWVSDVLGNEVIVIPVTSADLEAGTMDTSKEFSVSLKQLLPYESD
jgi:hypothetical protein